MPVPYSAEQLRAATLELVARNGVRSCYIRPIVNRGYGQMGLNPLEAPVDVAIACWEWGAYLGESGKRDGVRAKVASWRRISPDSLIRLLLWRRASKLLQHHSTTALLITSKCRRSKMARLP